MTRAKCPVARLESERLAAARIEEGIETRLRATPEGPGRIVLQRELAAAKAISAELLEEQLGALARSEHGVVLQLIARYRAIDAGDSAKAERIDKTVREGVALVALAIGAQLTAPEQTAAK